MLEKVLKVQRADLAVGGLVAQRVLLASEGDPSRDQTDAFPFKVVSIVHTSCMTRAELRRPVLTPYRHSA